MKNINLLLVLATLLSMFRITTAASRFDLTWKKASLFSTANACKEAVAKKAIYCAKDTKSLYACQCNDVVGLGAYVYCGYSETEDDPKERETFEKYFIMKCPKLNHTVIAAAYENVTKYITTSKKVPNFNISVPSRVPIEYNSTLFKVTRFSIHQRYTNIDNAKYFGVGLLAYWLAIFTVFAVYRCLCMMNLSKYFQNNRAARFLQANVFFKPFLGKKYKASTAFGMVPITLDALIIIGFVAIDIVGCFWDIKFYDKNTIWPLKTTQLGRLYADRTGWISLFTMLLTFLFAGRNNIFLWCTGWNFQSFLTYHKWIARTTVFNIVIHSIAYLINTIYMNRFTTRSATGWYRWGCVATVVASTIVIQASYPLRKYSYEIFLYMHIVLAVFFVVGAWLHLANQELEYFMFAVSAIWCFDKLLRIVRLMIFGGFRKNNIAILDEENMILTVTDYNRALFKPQPGNFVFVYFGLKNTFWQSHPFTILSADAECIKVFIKAKKGCTRKVYNAIVASGKKSMDLRVCLEGPYGVSKYAMVSRSKNILMYSTNTAVSGPHSYLKEYVDKGLTSGKHIKFYWSIRHWETLDFLGKELEFFSKQDNLNIIVYISRFDDFKFGAFGRQSTKSISDSDSNASEWDKMESTKDPNLYNTSQLSDSEQITQSLPNIEFRRGRMNVNDTITRDIGECLDNTHITVMTCGHPEFCDEARASVLTNIVNCKNKTIELIDELQVW